MLSDAVHHSYFDFNVRKVSFGWVHLSQIMFFFLLFQIVQCSIKIELINDSWTELRGEIAGPPDTPYEGGKFVLEIKVPETYPFNPPKVKYITFL